MLNDNKILKKVLRYSENKNKSDLHSRYGNLNIELIQSIVTTQSIRCYDNAIYNEKKYDNKNLNEIVKKIAKRYVEGSASTKNGVLFNTDIIKIINVDRNSKNLANSVPIAPYPSAEQLNIPISDESGFNLPDFEDSEEVPDENTDIKIVIENGINKREIINCMTQGFSIISQFKFFDDEYSDLVDRIDKNTMESYLCFITSALDYHKISSDYFKKSFLKVVNDFLESIKKSIDGRVGSPLSLIKHRDGFKLNSNLTNVGGIAPSRVEIESSKDRENPYKIVIQSKMMLLTLQEVVKGFYELISYNGLVGYSQIALLEILNITDNSISEMECFVHSANIVQVFMDYWDELENSLIKEGVIFEKGDHSMIPLVLSVLYNQRFYSDVRFLEIMGNIFDNYDDHSKWEFDDFKEIYKNHLYSTQYSDEIKTSFESVEDDEYSEGYDENLESNDVDELENVNFQSEDAEFYEDPNSLEDVGGNDELDENESITIDEILDKINSKGMDSLTQKELNILKGTV